MSILDRIRQRDPDHDFDPARDRAEAACDAAQDADAAERENWRARMTPAEVQAEQMRADEDARDLKGLPIGVSREQAVRRGWLEN